MAAVAVMDDMTTSLQDSREAATDIPGEFISAGLRSGAHGQRRTAPRIAARIANAGPAAALRRYPAATITCA
jgi:hypothetical protein